MLDQLRQFRAAQRPSGLLRDLAQFYHPAAGGLYSDQARICQFTTCGIFAETLPGFFFRTLNIQQIIGKLEEQAERLGKEIDAFRQGIGVS
jgi:aldehyde:ferredoxin oxidoreductase